MKFLHSHSTCQDLPRRECSAGGTRNNHSCLPVRAYRLFSQYRSPTRESQSVPMLNPYRIRVPIIRTDTIAITESTSLEYLREGFLGVAQSTTIKTQLMPNKLSNP